MQFCIWLVKGKEAGLRLAIHERWVDASVTKNADAKAMYDEILSFNIIVGEPIRC